MKVLLSKVRETLRKKRTRKILMRFVSVFSAAIVFITTYALILPAITLELKASCGIEEHQHSDECYEERLICGQEESGGHHHDDSCYEVRTELDCEIEEHQHSAEDGCYDADGNLVCELTEHVHDDSCYRNVKTLVCEEKESDGHHHTDECYEKVLVCKKEVHTHSEKCYEEGDPGAPVDETSKAEGDEAKGDMTSKTEDAAADETAAASDEELISEPYVPELDPLNMEAVLDQHTDIYYFHAEKGEEVPADSSDISDWKQVEKDTDLASTDLVKLYLAYSIPAGSLNKTNPIARYRLPGNIHLTDEQIKAINKNENGFYAGLVNSDAADSAGQYLGAEAVEGDRTPDRLLQDDEQEYISAVVRAENVYEDDRYLGQDLIFTFIPYTIEKNQDTYDAEQNPVSAGEAVTGWFACDFQLDQIDWEEEENEIADAHTEDGTGGRVEKAVRKTADILFVEKNEEEIIEEISRLLRLVEETAEEYQSGTLTADGDGYKVRLDYTEEAQIPEDAALSVREITPETDEEAYKSCLAQAREHVSGSGDEKSEVDTKASRFFDIEILVTEEDGTVRKIEPAAPVQVSIQIPEAAPETSVPGSESGGAQKADPRVLHFAEDGVEQVDSTTMTGDASAEDSNEGADQDTDADTGAGAGTDSEAETTSGNGEVTQVQFEAESFSVYGLVYTVDFHYEINGKMYDFSIPGGGFVSLEHVVEVLGIASADENTEKGTENAENDAENGNDFAGEVPGVDENGENGTVYEEAIKLNEVEVSESTKKFVMDVESVEFSSPELVWVGKVDEATTVGGLKEVKGLEVEYSTELTEEQIAEINAQTVEARDWALISIQPFTSEETLTVTMRDGEVFTIRVTDAQIKKDFIKASGEIYEITVTYDEYAQIPGDATLEITEFSEGSEEFEAAREYIIEKKLSEDPEFDGDTLGLSAFDLSILDKDGNQVEPKAVVRVSLTMKHMPEEMIEAEVQNSIEIHHLNESSGDVAVETVASAIDGNIQIEEETAKAEFQLESFSTFTISWGDSSNSDTTARWTRDGGNLFINIHYVDENGNAIRRPQNLGGVDGWTEQNSGNTVDHRIENNGDSQVTLDIESVLANDIPGKTFSRAYFKDNSGNQIDVTSVIGRRNTNWGQYTSLTYFNEGQPNFVYQTEGNNGGRLQGTDIYLEYSGGPHTTIHYGYMENGVFKEFDEQPNPTNTSTSFGWAHLIYDFAGTDDQGLHVDWKYSGTYYHTSETTNPTQDGVTMQPILRYNNINNKNAWRYYDGAIDTYGPLREDSNWHEVADGSEIYVVYEKPVIPMGGHPSLSGDGPDPDNPYILKESVENGDGTNTLSLSVTGSRAPMEPDKVADVIVVLDLSSSMRKDIGSNTAYDNGYQTNENSRYYQAKKAVQTLADTLYDLNGTDEKYRLGLITFSNKATVRQTPTADRDEFQAKLDGITKYEGSGTNWEHSLQLANQMSAPSDRSTYIVFITDGEPSVRQTRGDLTNEQLSGANYTLNPAQEGDLFHGGLSGGRLFISYSNPPDTTTPDFRDYFGSATFGGLENKEPWDTRNREAGIDEVASIVGHNKGFYAIGVSRDVNKLGEFVEAGGVDKDHYKLVRDSTAFDGVINSILGELTNLDGETGQANVKIYDGITDLTQTIAKVNQNENRLIGADGNFKYYKSTAPENWSTWTAEQKAAYALGVEYANLTELPNEYESYSPDEKNAYELGKQISSSFSEWTTRAEDGCAAAVYNTRTGAVEWNMGETFMLEDGVTYKVSFICWPSQDAYDIIAKLENGTITFGDLDVYDQEVWDQFEYDAAANAYTLKTNEEGANTTYQKAKKIGDSITTSGAPQELLFGEVPNLNLAKQQIYIHKEWENSLDEESEDSVNLGVIADGDENDLYKIIPVGANDDPDLDWRGSAFVSTGLLEIESGKMTLYEVGHDFTITENVEGGPNYNWDLTTDTYRPMVITDSANGYSTPTTVILKKVKSTDSYDYQIGNEYYAIVTDSNSALNAVNHRRSHIEIMKNVDGNNAPKKDRFTINVQVTNSKADTGDLNNTDSDAWVWFSIYDSDGEILKTTSLDDVDFVTADNIKYELIINGQKSTVDTLDESNISDFSGFCCVPSETVIKAMLPHGYILDVINLPIGSECLITEPANGIPAGYDIESIVETRSYYDEDNNEDKEETIQTVNTGTITAVIGYNESTYKVTVNNKWNTIDVQLKKVKEDKVSVLSGSTFELTRYSNGTWTDTVLNDITPGAPATGETPAVPNPISFGGLGIGKYRLTEVDSPDGYIVLIKNVYFEVYKQNGSVSLSMRLIDENGVPLTNDEIESLASGVTLDSSSNGQNTIIYTLTVINPPGAALPNTGGPGTRLFTILGSILILGAGALLWRRRRLI